MKISRSDYVTSGKTISLIVFIINEKRWKAHKNKIKTKNK